MRDNEKNVIEGVAPSRMKTKEEGNVDVIERDRNTWRESNQ